MGFFATSPSLRLAERLDTIPGAVAQAWLASHATRLEQAPSPPTPSAHEEVAPSPRRKP